MQKIEAFAQAAGLLGAQLHRGVVTNSFLTVADCDREAKTGLYVYEADGICCLEQPYTGIYQGDEALWTVLAADAAPEGRNPQ